MYKERIKISYQIYDLVDASGATSMSRTDAETEDFVKLELEEKRRNAYAEEQKRKERRSEREIMRLLNSKQNEG